MMPVVKHVGTVGTLVASKQEVPGERIRGRTACRKQVTSFEYKFVIGLDKVADEIVEVLQIERLGR